MDLMVRRRGPSWRKPVRWLGGGEPMTSKSMPVVAAPSAAPSSPKSATRS